MSCVSEAEPEVQQSELAGPGEARNSRIPQVTLGPLLLHQAKLVGGGRGECFLVIQEGHSIMVVSVSVR